MKYNIQKINQIGRQVISGSGGTAAIGILTQTRMSYLGRVSEGRAGLCMLC